MKDGEAKWFNFNEDGFQCECSGFEFFRYVEDECYRLLKRAIELTKGNPNRDELMKLFYQFNNLNEVTIREAEECPIPYEGEDLGYGEDDLVYDEAYNRTGDNQADRLFADNE